MATHELLTKRCKCGRWLVVDDVEDVAPFDGSAWFADDDGRIIGIAIFTNHTAADRAASAAGWQVLSESIGGDLCPACKEGA